MNLFEAYANSVITAPDKRRLRRAETRVQRPQEKALRERDALFALWRTHHKAQHEALLVGPYGAAAQALIDFMKALSLEDGALLIEHVDAGPWREADADTRFIVLQLIGTALVRLREANCLEPYDDSMPFSDERPTAYELIRAELTHD
jgi:hypothetical protein